MSIRMRRPETVKLEISQGDWLLVKKRLTSGEDRQRLARMLNPDGSINPVKPGHSKVISYLLDWSFQDADGKPIVIVDQPEDIVSAALDNLETEDFREALKAIEAHEERVSAEREAEKNAQAGESPLSPISSSADSCKGGDTSGPTTLTPMSVAS